MAVITNKGVDGNVGGFGQRPGTPISGEEAPGPGVNEPAIFSGGDGLILVEGTALARRVESSVELALEWDEIYFQGQYTLGALVLKSIKISGGIKQATADLSMVRRFCGMQYTDLDNATMRDIRYIPPVDIVLVLDKSMLPENVKSYEAVLIYNAQMNSFSLPISAASTVFNDQKWTAMNMAWRNYNSQKQINLKGRWIETDGLAYNNNTVGGSPEANRGGGGETTSTW